MNLFKNSKILFSLITFAAAAETPTAAPEHDILKSAALQKIAENVNITNEGAAKYLDSMLEIMIEQLKPMIEKFNAVDPSFTVDKLEEKLKSMEYIDELTERIIVARNAGKAIFENLKNTQMSLLYSDEITNKIITDDQLFPLSVAVLKNYKKKHANTLNFTEFMASKEYDEYVRQFLNDFVMLVIRKKGGKSHTALEKELTEVQSNIKFSVMILIALVSILILELAALVVLKRKQGTDKVDVPENE